MNYENQFGGRYDVGIVNAIPDILKERRDEGTAVPQQQQEYDTASRMADLFSRYAMAGIGTPKNHMLATIKKTWESLSPERRQGLINMYYKTNVYPRAKAVRDVLDKNPELKQVIMSESRENRKNNPGRESGIVMRNSLLGGAIGALAPLSLLAIKKMKKAPVFAASAIGSMIGLGIGNSIGTSKAIAYAKAHPISPVTIAKRKGIVNGNK